MFEVAVKPQVMQQVAMKLQQPIDMDNDGNDDKVKLGLTASPSVQQQSQQPQE